MSESITQSAPPALSSSALKWWLATPTQGIPAAWAAATSWGVSPTTNAWSGVTEPPETTAARCSAILVSSPRSVESEP